jgi:subfamily B ATP-binding cassette protein MsbA
MMAVFTIISIPLIIPFFHFLFSTQPDQTEKPDKILDIIGWLQYYFLKIINEQGAIKALLICCVFIIVTIFLKNFFRYLALYIMVPVRSGVVRDLRQKLYASFMSLSFSQDRDQRRGDQMTRMANDVQEIEWNMLRFIDTLIKSPIIIVGAILLMLSISVKLSLFVVLLMAFTAIVIGTLSRQLKRQSSQLQERLSQITGTIDESLDGSLLIRIYGVTAYWKERFSKFNNAYRNKFNKVSRRQELSSPLSEFLGVTVVVALLWYGARLVMVDQLVPETFFAFVLAFYHVIEPLKSFTTAYYYIKRGGASLERIEASISLTQNESRSIETESLKFEDRIEFKDVSFSYDDHKVLDGLNLSIGKSEKIALVGASGSGKSTIVRLLTKLIDCQEGEIEIDGVNIKRIKRQELYANIGFVSQQSFLFNDTIRNNITMGRPGFDDETIMKCLQLAYADTFVNRLPAGLDSMVGERGNLLSGGEKQRLTIARALLQDPAILILDEPTSALDPNSEQVVSRAITNVLKDRTAVIIAHRLSTIKNVNNIFVIDNGKVVEQGSHEKLIKKMGKYAQYVNIQSM